MCVCCRLNCCRLLPRPFENLICWGSLFLLNGKKTNFKCNETVNNAPTCTHFVIIFTVNICIDMKRIYWCISVGFCALLCCCCVRSSNSLLAICFVDFVCFFLGNFVESVCACASVCVWIDIVFVSLSCTLFLVSSSLLLNSLIFLFWLFFTSQSMVEFDVQFEFRIRICLIITSHQLNLLWF